MLASKFAPLQIVDVRRFWIARVVSVVGDKIYYVVLTAHVFTQSQSALAVSIMLLCRTAPALLLSPLAGVLGDRLNRKMLMCVSDITRAVVLVALAYATELWQIYVAVFLIGALGTLFAPSAGALLPSLVVRDMLKDTNALFSVGTQLAGMVGPSLGGLLLGYLHHQWAFILNALSFIVSASLVLSLAVTSSPGHTARTRFWSDSVLGIREVLSCPRYRLIALSNAVMMLGAGFLNALLFVFASRELGATAVHYGFMSSAISAGALVGAVIGARLRVTSTTQLTVLMISGLALTGFGVAAMGVLRSIAASIAFLSVIGAGNSIYNIFSLTVMQASLPNSVLARAHGFLSTATTTASLLMLALAGALGDFFGTPILFVTAGAISIVYSLLVIRRLPAEDAGV